MQSVYTNIVGVSWVVLLLVWAPGYFTSKRTARVPNLALQIPTSALLVVCFVLLFNPRLWGLGRSVTPHTAAFGLTGLALDLAGVAFAICARVMLGRNWSGMVMTVKEDHQLVQSGPYAIVRHPIYTGLASAILGTALTVGTLASYIGVAAGLTALLVRIHVEEKLMADQFGEAHAAYRRRTKKLIPFIW